MRAFLIALAASLALGHASAQTAPVIPPSEGEDDAGASDGAHKIITSAPLPAPPETPQETLNAIRLRGLNKVTARVTVFDALLGTVMRFGNLEIIARRCWKAPPEERPEDAALLEIRELKQGEEPQTVFTGWMFVSSPGLSGLEHPVYDITMLACEHMDVKDE